MRVAILVHMQWPFGEQAEFVALGIRHHQEATGLGALHLSTTECLTRAAVARTSSQIRSGWTRFLPGLWLGYPLKAEMITPGASCRQEDIGTPALPHRPAEQRTPKRGEPLGNSMQSTIIHRNHALTGSSSSFKRSAEPLIHVRHLYAMP